MEFFLFAGLMTIDMLIFAIMAKFYKHKNYSNDDELSDTALDQDMTLEQKGEINPSFSTTEETIKL